MADLYDTVIIGGGTAGLSAAIYTCRSNMKTAVMERLKCGGQILITNDIENYPGFDRVTGPDLSDLMEKQARKFGAEIVYDEVVELDLHTDPKMVRANQSSYLGKTVIIATGGDCNKLEVPGEAEFSGKGVSYCATCDANFFEGMDVGLVGGGDSALQEGIYLSRIVNSVTIIHRRDQLRAQPALQKMAFERPNISFIWNTVVQEIQGNDLMEKLVLKNVKSSEMSELRVPGLFVFVGFHPNIACLKGSGVEMDEAGHVLTDIKMHTNIPGVFAAGDIRQFSDKQLGQATGDGIAAALSAYEYATGASKHH